MSSSPADNPISTINELPLKWLIFCAVVDNYGDMGVCWRLANQLHRQYGQDVSVCVDDFASFMSFVGRPDLRGCESASIDGVGISQWGIGSVFEKRLGQALESVDVLIEAFACDIPAVGLTHMASCQTQPLWINLEYLSAESWVADCHGLTSMLSAQSHESESQTLVKYFFFPGFERRTGGLLRERDILEHHQQWQSDISGSRAQWLTDFNLEREQAPLAADWLSIFSYESPALTSFLASMVTAEQGVVCMVPLGRAIHSLSEVLGVSEPLVPGCYHRGALSVCVLPFLSQDDFDRLLGLCDFNVVRGEDSFIRAQWAAKPFLWHIYPQEDSVHLSKLDAYLKLYAEQQPASERESCEQLARFWRRWNLDEDCSEMWHHLRPQLPRLGMHAVEWRRIMAQVPDLSANLLEFCRQRISAVD